MNKVHAQTSQFYTQIFSGTAILTIAAYNKIISCHIQFVQIIQSHTLFENTIQTIYLKLYVIHSICFAASVYTPAFPHRSIYQRKNNIFYLPSLIISSASWSSLLTIASVSSDKKSGNNFNLWFAFRPLLLSVNF